MAIKMMSKMLTNTEVIAMIKALRKTKLFTIDRDYSAKTISITHNKSGKEVFRSLLGQGVWMTRMADNLLE